MANQFNIPANLNRILASVIVPAYPQLSVTAPFLGEEGISLAFEGEAVTFIRTMTSNVTSPEPLQMCTLSINLIKTLPLAQLYESQRQTNAQLGGMTVYTDASTLGPYNLIQCAIQNVRELRLNGRDAGYVVTVMGAYPLNSSMYS